MILSPPTLTEGTPVSGMYLRTHRGFFLSISELNAQNGVIRMSVVICKVPGCKRRGNVYGRGAGVIPGYCHYHRAMFLAKRTKKVVEKAMNELDKIYLGKK